MAAMAVHLGALSHGVDVTAWGASSCREGDKKSFCL